MTPLIVILVAKVQVQKPDIFQGFSGAQSFFLIFLKKSSNQTFRRLRTFKFQLGWKKYLSFDNIVNCFHMILRLKRSYSCHQLVKSNSKSPQINHFIISSSFKHLWSSKIRSSCQSKHFSFSSSFFNFFAYAKVNQFNTSIFLVIEYIVRFDISMTNFVHVNIPKSFKKLKCNQLKLFFRNNLHMFEIRKGKIFSYEIAFMCFCLKEESFVSNYIGMFQSLYIKKASLDIQKMLSFKFYSFYSTNLSGASLQTFFHNTVRSLSCFFSHLVLIIEQ